jgi:hypothetical protein
MRGEALLGPFPTDISPLTQISLPGQSYPAYQKDGEAYLQLQDPRLPELPPEWERVSHDLGSYYTVFRHKETGEWCYSHLDDPRCDLDALEERGVRIKEFLLV